MRDAIADPTVTTGSRGRDGPTLSDTDLYRRGTETLLASWEHYARAATGAAVQRSAGVASAVFPSEPERSVYNNAVLERDLAAGERAEAIGAMEAAYQSAGVTRFAAWVHEGDEAMRSELEGRGYTLDEVTRAMGMRLDDLRLPRPDLELATADWSEHLRIAGVPPDLLSDLDTVAFHILVARLCGESVATAIAFDFATDCGIYNAGTLERARRRGLGTALTALHLHDAIARGRRTASLHATAIAERVYASVGFRDLGRILEFVPPQPSRANRGHRNRRDRIGRDQGPSAAIAVGDTAHEGRECSRDLVACRGVNDRPVWADGIPGQRNARARRLNDVGVDVAEDLAERVVRVRPACRGGRARGVDPRDRLAVRAAIADGPLQ
jgi:ribosomal protein S18 acetylase RimI-like enzyme